jgi:hypothetical protein
VPRLVERDRVELLLAPLVGLLPGEERPLADVRRGGAEDEVRLGCPGRAEAVLCDEPCQHLRDRGLAGTAADFGVTSPSRSSHDRLTLTMLRIFEPE